MDSPVKPPENQNAPETEREERHDGSAWEAERILDNGQIRAGARGKLRGLWLKALAVRVLALLPYFALMLLLGYLVLFVFKMYRYSFSTGKISLDPGGWLILGAAGLLIDPVLSLGFIRYYLMIAKGEKAKIGTCFFFFRNHPLKAIGLRLAISFKILAWMLPGLGAALLGIGADSIIFFILGAILMVGFAIPAAYRYVLIPFCLAEDPNHGIGEAVEEGIELMQGEKWTLFCLMFVTMGWAQVIQAILQRAVPALNEWYFPLGFALLVMPLTVYWEVSAALFYVNRKGIYDSGAGAA